jgi:ABC-type multidrug transport system fused ATPase/permease subunit
VVQETIGGIRLVKSFGGEAYEERRFRAVSDRLARASRAWPASTSWRSR